jgi:hypothetical protein
MMISGILLRSLRASATTSAKTSATAQGAVKDEN